ncbi:MAG: D-2-hydroxyacid dehydrogenase [Granulosicoccus sp.]|nr:D-2-hydroxyacid dehydrogenase [Granulosicoccus sp.]
MNRKKVVLLDRDTMGPDIELTRPDFEHEWVEYDRTSEDQVVERLAGAEVAITNKVPLREASLSSLPDLKMISVAATGYDVIDIDACIKRGIQVSNVRGYAINTVPEHTFSLILSLRRSINAYAQDVIDGEWERAQQFCFFNHPISDLAGSRLGLIGEGAIGQAVAQLGRAFGMEIMFAAHKGVDGLGPLYTPWDEVIETADVISLHAPLTKHTHHCIGPAEFAQMKRKPLIVNTARGGLVDEAALVTALKAGQISGIGFDVFSQEPPDNTNPIMSVLERPDVVATPHIAWASIEARREVWRQTMLHINDYARNVVTNNLT